MTLTAADHLHPPPSTTTATTTTTRTGSHSNNNDKKSSAGAVSYAETLAIAGFGGMFAWCFTHPFEMWKNTVMTATPHTRAWAALRATAQKGFYTGLTSGLARQVVYATLRLGCYPIFRDALLRAECAMGMRSDGSDGSASGGVATASMFERALAGASAGCFASFMSSPIEVCLVLQTTSKERLSAVQAFTGIWRDHGLAGYWRGFGALGTRASLVGVAQVAVHDQVLTKLRALNRRRADAHATSSNNSAVATTTTPAAWPDNVVVNVASVITAFFYAVVTMPVEVARVRMSAEAKLPVGATRRYRNTVQCMTRIAKEEGCLAMYDAFVPYFSRCAMHTVICFLAIESLTRTLRERRATV